MHIRASRASFAVQFGLLAGLGSALFGAVEPPLAEAGPLCIMEGQCTFVKPMFMIIADYSTSMNAQFAPMKTRWQSAVDAIVTMVDAENGYLPGNVLLGLMRFGHDPQPAEMGTTIPNDDSGIVDGQKIDVGFYDEADPNKMYLECNGAAIKTAIFGVPPPLDGSLVGIGTWTKGAIDRAKAYFAQTRADHPNDMKDRRQAIVLLTDGEWTDPTGTMKLQPAGQNPAITAKDLWDNEATPTYVVALGEAMGKMFADELANSGGTGQALDAMNPDQLVMALAQVVEELKQDVIEPVCTPGLLRIMVLLDASSSMLNIAGGTMYGGQGQTGWDQARAALAGDNSLFDHVVDAQMQEVQNLVHLGLAVFGHNKPDPGEQQILVDYGPCNKDNFAWALDPNSSCVAPDCTDPWGGPPIVWTFHDGSQIDPPGFKAKTVSHMPRCNKSDQAPLQNACIGSGTYTHLGLQLIAENLATYKQACQQPGAEFPCDASTPFINLLITDGVYNSTDAQVQGPLEQMYAAGVKTYVIGFGDLVNTQEALVKLQKMAGWGSGGTEMYYDANNQMQLQAALAAIIEGLPLDPCCQLYDCELGGEDPPDDGCTCGNGVLEPCGEDPGYEQCDDGNKISGDGCSAWCFLEEAETTTGTTTEGTETASSGGSTTTDGSTAGGSTAAGETTVGETTGADATTGTSGEVVTTGAVATTSDASSTGDSSGGPTTTEATTTDDGCGCATDGRSRGAPALLLALLLRRRARTGTAATARPARSTSP